MDINSQNFNARMESLLTDRVNNHAIWHYTHRCQGDRNACYYLFKGYFRRAFEDNFDTMSLTVWDHLHLQNLRSYYWTRYLYWTMSSPDDHGIDLDQYSCIEAEYRAASDASNSFFEYAVAPSEALALPSVFMDCFKWEEGDYPVEWELPPV